jgi:hypothetical protein
MKTPVPPAPEPQVSGFERPEANASRNFGQIALALPSCGFDNGSLTEILVGNKSWPKQVLGCFFQKASL